MAVSHKPDTGLDPRYRPSHCRVPSLPVPVVLSFPAPRLCLPVAVVVVGDKRFFPAIGSIDDVDDGGERRARNPERSISRDGRRKLKSSALLREEERDYERGEAGRVVIVKMVSRVKTLESVAARALPHCSTSLDGRLITLPPARRDTLIKDGIRSRDEQKGSRARATTSP